MWYSYEPRLFGRAFAALSLGSGQRRHCNRSMFSRHGCLGNMKMLIQPYDPARCGLEAQVGDRILGVSESAQVRRTRRSRDEEEEKNLEKPGEQSQRETRGSREYAPDEGSAEQGRKKAEIAMKMGWKRKARAKRRQLQATSRDIVSRGRSTVQAPGEGLNRPFY